MEQQGVSVVKNYRIVVLPGDGIGPEIVEAALEVLDTLQEVIGEFRLSYQIHRAGASLYQETGEPIGEEAIEAFRDCRVALKGPVGLPRVRKPDGTEAGLLGGILRCGFDLYANVRPICLLPRVPGPLAGITPEGLDYIIVRENTEGLYLSRGLGLVTPQAATDTMLMTAKGCERIARFAFRTALLKKRGAPEDGKKRVTLVDKSNVLRSFAFFRKIYLQVAEEFPEVETECMYVDAACAALISRPGHFQVIVTENLFGDILSDLGGATVGGLGFCPSGNIGETHAYFEPIHGSAPDIAGRGLANPTAQILSAAMMLDYLGEQRAAEMLRSAVKRVWAEALVRLEAGGWVIGGSQSVTRAIKDMLLEAKGGAHEIR